MNLRDLSDSFGDFWKQFSKMPSGLVGLGLLGFFFFLAAFGALFIPFPDATEHWHDITYWQDQPRGAPPSWMAAFQGGVPSQRLTPASAAQEDLDGIEARVFTFTYNSEGTEAPKDLILRFQGTGQVPVLVTFTRPDGKGAEIWRDQVDLTPGETARVSLSNAAVTGFKDLLSTYGLDEVNGINADTFQPLRYAMADAVPGIADHPHPLKGTYTLTVKALILDPAFSVDSAEVFVSGNVSGLLGTDLSKRDIFTGIVLGIRWALLIGFVTSFLTVFLGVFLGVVGAYFGGKVDWALNRLYEYVYLMPVLPFLIVTAAVFKPSIWTLVGLICLFFWTGPFKPVYSMALQIREETFVEASRALGAGRLRIILRHIVPILLPFSFASMALSIPGVIVYEASISLIGLGDSSIVTWGQILHDAFTQGAVIGNLWWWVVTPGLMIALMGTAFAFLGTALDKILHPKLKTR